jgi:hypothetical protein
MARWFDRCYGPDLMVGRPEEAQQTLERELDVCTIIEILKSRDVPHMARMKNVYIGAGLGRSA